MIDTLESFDQHLLLAINGANSDFFDGLFYALTQTVASIPVFILAVFLLWKKFGWRNTLFCVLVIGCAIGLSDLISTECFKKVVCRYRPTHNLEIGGFVHVVNGYTGGMYGFVSSHAANMFAFAVGVSLFLKHKLWAVVFLGWSMLICYTRMYLGVHYPADIFCGALLGSLVAVILYYVFIRINAKYNPTSNLLNTNS
ncbi:MAG: phosphatase PAP2 family protein [Bacteroidales bacterium]|nr:phosphatase PAP2 family protein [Bacteroidales bacterium]